MSWLRCSACKRDIGFGAAHWVCSVSTCNRSNTNYKFCSVACWDSHVATLRHRDSWAVEARAPSKEQWAIEQEDAPTPPPPPPRATPGSTPDSPPRRVVAPPTPAPVPAPTVRPVSSSGGTAPQLNLQPADRDVLIVVSKLKKYIKDRSGFNCSDAVADAISEHVRAICDESIRAAAMDDRKTVLDRDVPKPRR
ncbi:MAG TPA: hypothetical protein VM261_37545 [Kofleriaceae bacterium]|nr:hypothetical protein [Kofleriaceae bacterium]